MHWAYYSWYEALSHLQSQHGNALFFASGLVSSHLLLHKCKTAVNKAWLPEQLTISLLLEDFSEHMCILQSVTVVDLIIQYWRVAIIAIAYPELYHFLSGIGGHRPWVKHSAATTVDGPENIVRYRQTKRWALNLLQEDYRWLPLGIRRELPAVVTDCCLRRDQTILWETLRQHVHAGGEDSRPLKPKCPLDNKVAKDGILKAGDK